LVRIFERQNFEPSYGKAGILLRRRMLPS